MLGAADRRGRVATRLGRRRRDRRAGARRLEPARRDPRHRVGERRRMGRAGRRALGPSRPDPRRSLVRDGLDTPGRGPHRARHACVRWVARRVQRRDHGGGGWGRPVRRPARERCRREGDGRGRQPRTRGRSPRARSRRRRRRPRGGRGALRPDPRVGGRPEPGGRARPRVAGRDRRVVRELLERAHDVRRARVLPSRPADAQGVPRDVRAARGPARHGGAREARRTGLERRDCGSRSVWWSRGPTPRRP